MTAAQPPPRLSAQTPIGPPLSVAYIDRGIDLITTRALSVVAELGVADHLAGGPRPVGELAEATGTHGPSLARVLRVLVPAEILAEPEPGVFSLTALGDCLRSDHPTSIRATMRIFEGVMLRGLSALDHAVRTGRPAGEAALGAGFFEYLSAHPDEGDVFNEAMTELRRLFVPAVLAAYDFSGVGTLVDVGGGHGFFLARVLEAYPGIKGVLFDLPEVAQGAAAALEAAGLSARSDVVAGSFFEAVPHGGDAYVLSWIIHDWEEEQALAILRTCRAAMGPGARLLLVESVLPERGHDPFGCALDVAMLVLGGRERTEAEYADLLARAGFELSRVVPTMAPLSVVEARTA